MAKSQNVQHGVLCTSQQNRRTHIELTPVSSSLYPPMPENTDQPQKRPSRRKRSSILPADAPDVVSPCISICEIDQSQGVCKGCYRTLEEIATWSRLDNQQRWDIVQSLRDRRQSFD